MKKALFVAYDFQPCANVSGSIRSVKFADKLPRHGWNPTVLASYEPEALTQGEIMPEVHRIRSITPWSRPWEIRPYGWAASLYRRAEQLLKKHRHDLIYVSCPPFAQTLVCVKLKRRYKLPMVVDFRDAWSLDPYQEGGKLKKAVYRYLFPAMEKYVLRYTDQLIVNTPSMLQAYRKRYPRLASRMKLIPNGFDESDFSSPANQRTETAAMQLLYVGRFGIGGRSAVPLLTSLKEVVDEGLSINLSVVGSQPPELEALVAKLELHHHVFLQGATDHAKAVSRMFDCDVLVLYQELSNAEIQAVAGKTYEYLRTGKPILSIAPPGDNQDLVQSFSRYAKLVTSTLTGDIATALREMYRDWQADQLPGYSTPNPEYLALYERDSLTRKLAGVFSELTASR